MVLVKNSYNVKYINIVYSGTFKSYILFYIIFFFLNLLQEFLIKDNILQSKLI